MSEVWDQRPIQILVVLSFMLQVFLFFAGSSRHRSSNKFLKLVLWLVYLGADPLAIYILGLFSRQLDAAPTGGRLSEIHPLPFIWAPFLLIHLGGQDNITAFAIEDNNLWLRHFLNLVLQVALAMYVFWRSTVWRNAHLLGTAIFIFLAGMLKYGERTMALKYSTLTSLGSFTADDNKLPPQRQTVVDDEKLYSKVISTALNSVVGVRDVFGGRTIIQINGAHRDAFTRFHGIESWDLSLKVLEVELRLLYDDIYTKALVLRTRTGIIMRCISQVSIVVALVIFFSISDKQRYSKADVAITYVLFLGGIFLEVCAALFMVVMSAWTWGWLEARNYRWLARMSWCLLSSRVVLPKKRTLWSNSMGQYDLFLYAGHYDGRAMSWKQRVMKTIRATVNFVGVGKGTLFWFSKLLDTTDVTVDKEIMEFIAQGVQRYSSGSWAQQFRLSPVISKMRDRFGNDFGCTVVFLHMLTALHLSELSPPHSDMGANSKGSIDTVEVCRKLSSYMFYLFVTHPEMLPANGSTESTLESFLKKVVTKTDVSSSTDGKNGSAILISKARVALKRTWGIPDINPCAESLKEIKEIWIRLIIYMAGKSRPEMHATRLARGGELFTFVWLFMLHNNLGDLGTKRIELSDVYLQGPMA
jgi:hypothetical protein